MKRQAEHVAQHRSYVQSQSRDRGQVGGRLFRDPPETLPRHSKAPRLQGSGRCRVKGPEESWVPLATSDSSIQVLHHKLLRSVSDQIPRTCSHCTSVFGRPPRGLPKSKPEPHHDPHSVFGFSPLKSRVPRGGCVSKSPCPGHLAWLPARLHAAPVAAAASGQGLRAFETQHVRVQSLKRYRTSLCDSLATAWHRMPHAPPAESRQRGWASHQLLKRHPWNSQGLGHLRAISTKARHLDTPSSEGWVSEKCVFAFLE